NEASAYPGAHLGWQGEAAVDQSVLVPLQIRTSLGRLSFFTTTTVFGTPMDVTLAEIAIEMFFAADAATAAAVRGEASRACRAVSCVNEFQAGDAGDNEENRADAQQVLRFVEQRHAEDRDAHGADPGPHGVAGADRDGAHRHAEEVDASDHRDDRDDGRQ